MWREGLSWSVLSVDYQRILQVLADRHRHHQGPLTCQELAALFGLDAVPAKVEALRSKAKRLVGRGWLVERQPGGVGPAGDELICAAAPSVSVAEQQLRAGGGVGPQSVAHVHREYDPPVGGTRQRRRGQEAAQAARFQPAVVDGVV
jgi:hypothetical protein